MSDNPSDRRQYPRVSAPILFESARLGSPRKPVIDIGLGGFRVYSDDSFRTGERLNLTLMLPNGSTVECTVRVAWMTALPSTAPAKYDVGFELLDAHGDGLNRLAEVLDRYG